MRREVKEGIPKTNSKQKPLLILDIDEVFRHMTKADATNNALKEHGIQLSDFDDDLRDDILEAWRAKKKFFTERGETMGTFYALAKKRVKIRELLELSKTTPEKAEKLITQAREEAGLTPDFEKKLGERFKAHNYPTEAQLLDDIKFEHKEAIKQAEKTHQIVFATSSDSNSTRLWLNHHGFSHLPMIGKEDVPEGKTKPSPHAYWQSLMKLGLISDYKHPELTVVGDAKGDMDAAIRLEEVLNKRPNSPKINRVIVLTGKTDPNVESVSASRATHVFKDFTDFAQNMHNLSELKQYGKGRTGFRVSPKAERILNRNLNERR